MMLSQNNPNLWPKDFLTQQYLFFASENHQCVFPHPRLEPIVTLSIQISLHRDFHNQVLYIFWSHLNFLQDASSFFYYKRKQTISPISFSHQKISRPSLLSPQSSLLQLLFHVLDCSVISSFSLNLKLLSLACQRAVWNLASHWPEEICSYSISVGQLLSFKWWVLEQRW